MDRRSESGMLFHRSGAAFLKALPPKVTVCTCGLTNKFLLSLLVLHSGLRSRRSLRYYGASPFFSHNGSQWRSSITGDMWSYFFFIVISLAEDFWTHHNLFKRQSGNPYSKALQLSSRDVTKVWTIVFAASSVIHFHTWYILLSS